MRRQTARHFPVPHRSPLALFRQNGANEQTRGRRRARERRARILRRRRAISRTRGITAAQRQTIGRLRFREEIFSRTERRVFRGNRPLCCLRRPGLGAPAARMRGGEIRLCVWVGGRKYAVSIPHPFAHVYRPDCRESAGQAGAVENEQVFVAYKRLRHV